MPTKAAPPIDHRLGGRERGGLYRLGVEGHSAAPRPGWQGGWCWEPHEEKNQLYWLLIHRKVGAQIPKKGLKPCPGTAGGRCEVWVSGHSGGPTGSLMVYSPGSGTAEVTGHPGWAAHKARTLLHWQRVGIASSLWKCPKMGPAP